MYSNLTEEQLWQNINNISQDWLKQYTQTIYSLIRDKGIVFDLIIGAGNTGLAMSEIAKIIYNVSNLTYPYRIRIPIYRFIPGKEDNDRYLFDNSVLEKYVDMPKEMKINNVLFCDDEIYRGHLIQSVLKLLEQKGFVDFTTYIVAEDQGFKPENITSTSPIIFKPYAHEIEGLSNIITYNIPSYIKKPIRKHYSDEQLPQRKLLNVLLSLPTKSFNNGTPTYTYEVSEEIRHVVPLDQLQQEYKEYLVGSINTYISSILT